MCHSETSVNRAFPIIQARLLIVTLRQGRDQAIGYDSCIRDNEGAADLLLFHHRDQAITAVDDFRLPVGQHRQGQAECSLEDTAISSF